MPRLSNGLRNTLIGAACAALLVFAAAGASAEVYKWVDAKGQTHYSDMPPEGNVKVVPLQLSTLPPSAKAGDAPAVNPKTEALKGKTIGVVKPDDSPEAQAQRAANCDHMRNEQTLLNQGTRVFTLDAKGERSYLDDDTRSARLAELQDQIKSGCN
jgi:hypothetical protein